MDRVVTTMQKDQVRLAPTDPLWDSYNTLLLSPDRARIRKMLVRYRLFESTLDVPGDVVECGVFKGAGLMYWAKLIEIFAGNSRKRVIGFDVFGAFASVPLERAEQTVAAAHDAIGDGVGLAHIRSLVREAGLVDRIELVDGEIERTAPEWVASNFGARISLLNLDLDTYSGTLAALDAFWPLVSHGGVVVLDEYALRGMGESDAADEFFGSRGVRPRAVPFAETPTAYVIKP
jgi:hypothetical protein